MKQIIECVPNFSEGRNMTVIRQITNDLHLVEGVMLLHTDSGRDTNRTVVTFAGSPEAVTEAAFRAVAKATEVINMADHTGVHPRFGATDVCPLVPVSGITMKETVVLARKLAKRIGEELKIPTYCYEHAAFSEVRKNLANVRSGEYEGLAEKLKDPIWKPDFGPAVFNARTGAIAVGARDFLVAYNISLDTTSIQKANAIAFDVREQGRVMREENSNSGKIMKNKEGQSLRIPGSLRSVKAIGWYIDTYGTAQVSLNLTNISITSIHVAFDEVRKKAESRGVHVTGSEIIGLVPLKAMLDAGRHYLRKQQNTVGYSDFIDVNEPELINIAVKSMGLDLYGPFVPEKKIIEYNIKNVAREKRAG